MPPILHRLYDRRVQLRCAAAIAAIFFPLFLLPPSAFAATPTTKTPRHKKPEEPKEVLIFKNGDRITGKLMNSTGTKIEFRSEVAGEITVPLKKIKELKSDRPFAIVPKESKGIRDRGTFVEGIIQFRANGILVVPITPQKARELTPTASKSEAKPSPATEATAATVAPPAALATTAITPSISSSTPILAKTTPSMAVKTGRLIPTDRLGYIVNDSTYQKEIGRKINWRTGWDGSITTGTTVIRATQNSYQLSTDVSLQRTIPTVIWLDPKLRTILHYTQSAGRISQPGTVTTVTNIFHISAERDEYFSRRGYYLQQVNFDHDTAQGLDLQQIYGAGAGATFFKTEDREFDVTADLHYESQAFNSTAKVTAFHRKLVGSIFSEAYSNKFADITFDEKTLADFAWNNENAFSASGTAGVRLPLYKRLAFSLTAIDNFQNDPQVGYKKNSLQLSTGLSFTLH